nr:helicase-related protein [Acuticoccus mangrovi]
MLARRTGLIGLPLRLLAREVYGRVVARVGPEVVALVTGEEKIIPAGARYYVATVEAMPLDLDTEFVAIDEVQLAADLERGRVFTDRLMRVRGRYETLLLGALTARGLLERLIPGINVVTRPRMSVLSYAGEKKLTRLPPRSAVVAFSANEVYAIAELIRRQRGGAAIVMGALSPRTRNAQVELFQSGDVDFLIATDAIGMGLNLDVDHVAFAAARKFDGYQYRNLNAGELGQIAGRAGRYTRNGTFGVTGRVAPFPDDLVEALETHAFAPHKVFQWRNPVLDFSSVAALRATLDEPPSEEGLTRAPLADDQTALEHATKTPHVMDMARTADTVERLWEVCQVPDYRKIAPANHADLILTLFEFLVRDGAIPDDWIARQVRYADRTDGDIDTLSNRIAHVRTWTFVANRNDWLKDPQEWREATRKVEDRLSDALHERLMQRFVDRRTSVLMKRLRENAMLESEVNDAGEVIVEGQHVGALHGFRFQADASSGDPRDQKALRAAAAKSLTKELERRADKVAAAPDSAFTLGSDAAVRWQGAVIAKVAAGEDALKPVVLLLADETLPQPSRERVQGRLNQWLAAHIEGLLKPLFDLRAADDLDGNARGLAYRMSEQLGSVERSAVAEEAKALDQTARAKMRALGVRFGAYHIFVPVLLKPAPSQLLAMLWALKNADLDVPGLVDVPQLSASGRTSIVVDPAVPAELYRIVGFRVCGPRAVRIDILERLADQIRPLVAWRPGPDSGEPPAGAVPQGGGFLVTVTMTSLLGCSGDDFAAILTSLGYRVDRHEASSAERDAMAAASEVKSRTKREPKPPRLATQAAPTQAASTTDAAAPDAPTTDAPTTDAPTTGASVPGALETDAAETEAAETDAAAMDAPVSDAATAEGAVEASPTETPSTEVEMEAVPPAAGAGEEPAAPRPDDVVEAAPQSVEPISVEPISAEPVSAESAATPYEQAEPAQDEVAPEESSPVAEAATLAPFLTDDEAPAAAVSLEPAATPEPAAPDAIEPEAIEPEAIEPEAAASEAVEPEAAEPTEPEAVEPRPEEPGADAVQAPAEATSEASAEAAADAGPTVIEVWRVPRFQRHDNRRRRGGGGRPGEGGERGDRPHEGRRRHRGEGSHSRGGGAQPAAGAQPTAGAPAAGAPSGPAEAPAGRSRGPDDHRRDDHRRDERRDDRREGKRGKKRGKPPRVEAESRPPRREREADPDSPFAALAALKQRLEKGDGDS